MQSDRSSQTHPLKSVLFLNNRRVTVDEVANQSVLRAWNGNRLGFSKDCARWIPSKSQKSRSALVGYVPASFEFVYKWMLRFILELSSLWMKHGSTTQRVWNGNIHSRQSKESSIFNQQQAKWCFYLHIYVYTFAKASSKTLSTWGHNSK